MSKRRKPTPESELRDAIDRMSKKSEAKENSSNSRQWRDYLTNVLNIHPATIESEKSRGFWENVRQGVNDRQQTELNRPTEIQLKESNSYEGKQPNNEKTYYRNKETGKFVSRYDIMGIPRPPKPEFRTVTFKNGRTVTFKNT